MRGSAYTFIYGGSISHGLTNYFKHKDNSSCMNHAMRGRIVWLNVLECTCIHILPRPNSVDAATVVNE